MVHRFAAEGYKQQAKAYTRGRPGYPPDAVAFMVEELKLAKATVLDVGAGTGKFTQALCRAAPEAKVMAIEPIANMRRELVAALPSVDVQDGTAERLPVGGQSVDAVVAAQAFHWFDG